MKPCRVFKLDLVRRPVVSEIGDAESFVVDLLSHCFGALVHRQLSDCFTLKTGVLPVSNLTRVPVDQGCSQLISVPCRQP